MLVLILTLFVLIVAFAGYAYGAPERERTTAELELQLHTKNVAGVEAVLIARRRFLSKQQVQDTMVWLVSQDPSLLSSTYSRTRDTTGHT